MCVCVCVAYSRPQTTWFAAAPLPCSCLFFTSLCCPSSVFAPLFSSFFSFGISFVSLRLILSPASASARLRFCVIRGFGVHLAKEPTRVEGRARRMPVAWCARHLAGSSHRRSTIDAVQVCCGAGGGAGRCVVERARPSSVGAGEHY